MPQNFYTLKEAAQKLGVSEEELRKMSKSGRPRGFLGRRASLRDAALVGGPGSGASEPGRPSGGQPGPPPIGVALGSIGVDIGWWLDSARRLDEAGYDALWCWDHFVSRGRLADPVVEQWTTLTAAAAVTTRILSKTNCLFTSTFRPAGTSFPHRPAALLLPGTCNPTAMPGNVHVVYLKNAVQ